MFIYVYLWLFMFIYVYLWVWTQDGCSFTMFYHVLPHCRFSNRKRPAVPPVMAHGPHVSGGHDVAAHAGAESADTGRCSWDIWDTALGEDWFQIASASSSYVRLVKQSVGFVWKCWVNIPNEIAIFHRDNDQQNHWFFSGYTTFSDKPSLFQKYRRAWCLDRCCSASNAMSSWNGVNWWPRCCNWPVLKVESIGLWWAIWYLYVFGLFANCIG